MVTCLSLRFPEKLWNIMEICRTDSIIWSKDGMTILIKYPQFQKEFMSRGKGFFKTDKITSFVRQLNLYGFMKLRGKVGSSKLDVEEFQNKNFIRNRFDLLKNVTRNTKANDKEDRRRRTKRKRHEFGPNVYRKSRGRRKRKTKEDKRRKIERAPLNSSGPLNRCNDILEEFPLLEQIPLYKKIDLVSLINDDNGDGMSQLETTLHDLEQSQDDDDDQVLFKYPAAVMKTPNVPSAAGGWTKNWNCDLAEALQSDKIVLEVNKTFKGTGHAGGKSISTSKRFQLWQSSCSSPATLKGKVTNGKKSYFSPEVKQTLCNWWKSKNGPSTTSWGSGKHQSQRSSANNWDVPDSGPQWYSTDYIPPAICQGMQTFTDSSHNFSNGEQSPEDTKVKNIDSPAVIAPLRVYSSLSNEILNSDGDLEVSEHNMTFEDDNANQSYSPACNGRENKTRITHSIRKTYWDRIKEVPRKTYQNPYGPPPPHSHKNGKRHTSTSPTLVNVSKCGTQNGTENVCYNHTESLYSDDARPKTPEVGRDELQRIVEELKSPAVGNYMTAVKLSESSQLPANDIINGSLNEEQFRTLVMDITDMAMEFEESRKVSTDDDTKVIPAPAEGTANDWNLASLDLLDNSRKDMVADSVGIPKVEISTPIVYPPRNTKSPLQQYMSNNGFGQSTPNAALLTEDDFQTTIFDTPRTCHSNPATHFLNSVRVIPDEREVDDVPATLHEFLNNNFMMSTPMVNPTIKRPVKSMIPPSPIISEYLDMIKETDHEEETYSSALQIASENADDQHYDIENNSDTERTSGSGASSPHEKRNFWRQRKGRGRKKRAHDEDKDYRPSRKIGPTQSSSSTCKSLTDHTYYITLPKFLRNGKVLYTPVKNVPEAISIENGHHSSTSEPVNMDHELENGELQARISEQRSQSKVSLLEESPNILHPRSIQERFLRSIVDVFQDMVPVPVQRSTQKSLYQVILNYLPRDQFNDMSALTAMNLREKLTTNGAGGIGKFKGLSFDVDDIDIDVEGE